MRVLIALLLAAVTLSAQEVFNDPDFTFSFNVPAGLEERSADGVDNGPRSASESGEVAHRFTFVDTMGRGRQVELLLADGPPPFGNPDQLVQAMEQEAAMKVDLKEPMKPPIYQPGVRLEGTRTNSNNIEMRVSVAYYILSPDPMRWGLMRFQAPAADWDAAGPEYLDALASVDFPLPDGALNAGVRPDGNRQRGRRRAGAGSETEDWSTLQVTGSLVLAAALLMSLFFAGRGSP